MQREKPDPCPDADQGLGTRPNNILKEYVSLSIRYNCMMLECYSLLKQIEPRPAMWTGEASLKSIRNYVSGYYHALLDNKIVNKPHTDEPFFDWVAKRLGYYESTAGWANMILAYSMGFEPGNINWNIVLTTPVTKEQHLKSVKMFYELLEQFKNEVENR